MVHLKGGSRPPWVGLGTAVWLQLASGNAYNFPLYSHSLKSVLGFSQQQLTMLGVANDIGENVGILPGIACNKFPPWIVLLIGAFASFLGCGVLWLAVSQTVQSLPYWQLWLALCVATNSGAWLGVAVLVTNMRNFPVSRGTVAGILKGYAGAECCSVHGNFRHLASQFLCQALALSHSRDPNFIIGHFIPLSDTVSYTFLVIMVLLLMAPLAIPVKMTLYPSNRSKLGTLGQPSDSVSEVDMLLAEGEGTVKKKRRPKRGEDFTFREAIVKADFWLLFFVNFAGVGSGVTVLNNLAQIGIAHGAEVTTVLLSLFSFFNFVGWLGGGIVSEHFVK
ncbi:hypothetical protein ACSBR2_040141 [Camellia fascicularis]